LCHDFVLCRFSSSSPSPFNVRCSCMHVWLYPFKATKSFFTHSSYVFLPLPLSLTLLIQHFYTPKPNLHYPFSPIDQTTTFCFVIPYLLCSSTQSVLLFKWTPLIHLTIIRYILSNLAISSTFIVHRLHLILFELPCKLLMATFPMFSVGPNLASHFITFVLPKFFWASFPHTLFPFLNLHRVCLRHQN